MIWLIFFTYQSTVIDSIVEYAGDGSNHAAVAFARAAGLAKMVELAEFAPGIMKKSAMGQYTTPRRSARSWTFEKFHWPETFLREHEVCALGSGGVRASTFITKEKVITFFTCLESKSKMSYVSMLSSQPLLVSPSLHVSTGNSNVWPKKIFHTIF